MNNIEKLIEELCPNGVRYQKVKEVCTTFSGGFVKKTKQDDSYPYPVFNGGTTATGYYSEYNTEANSIAISGRGSIGFVNWVDTKFWAGNSCHVINSNSKLLNNRFLYHYFKNQGPSLYRMRNTGSIPALNLAPLLEFKVPIPPLKIQNEIVNILDKFTELEADLEAELEARRKQLIHYSENLCTKDGDRFYEKKQLGEIATLIRGRRFVKDDIKDSGVPAIHYGEIYTKYNIKAYKSISYLDAEQAKKLRKVRSGDVVMVAAGETIEDIGKSVAWLGEEDIVIHDACIGISSVQLDPEFLAFYFDTFEFRSQLNERITSSKISAISPDKLSTTLVPLPKLVEQRNISQKLSAIFDLIYNYIPNEISARRKQFEYYRDKLLAFKELEAL